MMKQLIALGFIVLAIAPLSSTPRQAQIEARTNIGASEVRLALPEFQATSADANLGRLTALFNQVVHDDLDFSGNINLVNRSFYPLGRFQGPGDIKVDDWTKAGINAQYIAFGNAPISSVVTLYRGHGCGISAIAENRELMGSGLRSDLSDDGIRLVAHSFADSIVDKLFGGQVGIARTKIAYVATTSPSGANKNTTKEIYVMDYDGANAFPLTTYRSTSITPSWAPDGEKIAFTTYRTGVPNIEILSRIDRRSFPFRLWED